MKAVGYFYPVRVMVSALLCSVLVFSFSSCKKNKDSDPANEPPKPMGSLVIPDNFEWKMATLYSFIISGAEGQIVEIKTDNGQTLLHKSVIEQGKTETVIPLTLPSYMTEVLVNGRKIMLGPAVIHVNLNSLKELLTSTNKAINLDGSDDDVDVGNYSEFRPGTGPFTVEAWVNTTDKSADTWARKMVSKGLDFGIYIDPADGKVRGYINNISTLPSMTRVDDGNWHHVAFKRNGTTIKIFIDGNGEREDNNAGFGANLCSGASFKIGAMDEGGVCNSHWNGKLDEVRVWNSYRTAVEIHDNYDKKVPSGHCNLMGSWDCDEDSPVTGVLKDRSTHGHDGSFEHGCAPVLCPLPVLDSDGDGIPDVSDDYPNDPTRAFDNYYPALGQGTLAYEDLWPCKGDYDCNDMVLGYRFKTVTNAGNKVVEVFGTFELRAVGASMHNGFAFQLPNAALSLLTNLHVSSSTTPGYLFSLNGTTHQEMGQTRPVVPLFSNAHDFIPGMANTIPGATYYPPYIITLTLTVPLNTYTAADLALDTWNPFLISNMERGREVHLINRQPTNLADQHYFGYCQDASDPVALKFYQTSNKLPWALDFPENFEYPVEYAPVNAAYLKFVQWAESGGVVMTDWYKNTAPGYRNASLIYTH